MPARTPRDLVSIVLVLCLAACSGQAALSSGQVTPTPGTLETAGPTATPKPTAPRIPAPADLQGRWQTVINDADKPVLTLTDFKYTIERLGIGTGSIRVDGDQIVFFASNLCQGEGTYRWSIEGQTLTLAAVGPDPCPNRADAIRNRPFTRID